MKLAITEKDNIHPQWYKDAKTQTAATLPEFLRRLTEDYEHDYGTICHAIAAAALGAAYAVEDSPQGGITGFQSSAVMWQFIMEWQDYTDEPLRLTRYEEMLYPQYRDSFQTISRETWEWLQVKAKQLLAERAEPNTHPDVRAHWGQIVAGKVPFGYMVGE